MIDWTEQPEGRTVTFQLDKPTAMSLLCWVIAERMSRRVLQGDISRQVEATQVLDDCEYNPESFLDDLTIQKLYMAMHAGLFEQTELDEDKLSV